MDARDKERLRKNHSLLAQELEVTFLLTELFSQEVITADEMDEIEHTEPKTRKTRNTVLLSILPRKGADAYKVFCESLIENGYKHLSDALDNTEVAVSTDDWFCGIRDEVKHSVPTDKQLVAIAKDIGLGWEAIGLSLGLSRPEIDHCKMGNPLAPLMQILTMFSKWKSKNAKKATMDELANALRDNSVYDNAFKEILAALEAVSIQKYCKV